MSKPVYTASSRIGFGKYKNRLVSDILKTDARYLKWAWVERRLFDVNKHLYQLLSKIQSDITGLKLPSPVDTKLEQTVSQLVREIKFSKGEPQLTPEDFFEDIMDNPTYADVEGPGMEMAIDGLIEEVQALIKKLPENNQRVARTAIKRLWIEKVRMWNENT
jgi:uncharacterized protein (DUF3820 family)